MKTTYRQLRDWIALETLASVLRKSRPGVGAGVRNRTV